MPSSLVCQSWHQGVNQKIPTADHNATIMKESQCRGFQITGLFVFVCVYMHTCKYIIYIYICVMYVSYIHHIHIIFISYHIYIYIISIIYICFSVMCFPERRNSFFLCKKGAREICVRDAIEHLMKLSLQHTALVVCKRD